MLEHIVPNLVSRLANIHRDHHEIFVLILLIQPFK